MLLQKIAIKSLTAQSLATQTSVDSFSKADASVLRVFRLCDIANIDQTLCSFDFL